MKELQKINQDYEIELPSETKEILKTIFEQGTAENTAKCQSRDIKKFWQWANLRFGIEETYPTPVGLIINYITDHLGGMTPEIDKKLVEMGVKSRLGAHKLSTIKRRLYSLSSYHNLKGIKPNPCRDKAVLAVLGKAHRALVQNGVVIDKKEAATIEIMERLIATCQDDGLKGVRDAAILLTGFSSGGRRRSEIVRMKVEDLKVIEDGYTIKMNFSKGDYKGEAKEFPIKGLAAEALKEWLDKSEIKAGPLFRSIGRYGNVGDGLNDKAVNYIFKQRAKLAGLDLSKYSAHSLRSGFVSSCVIKGKSPYDIIQLTNHKSLKSIEVYLRSASAQINPAADLM